MSYARYRQTFAIPFTGNGTPATIHWSFSLQVLRRVVTIFNYYAYMHTAGSGGSSSLNVAINSVNLTPFVTTANSTGYKAASGTFPVTVTVTTSNVALELLQGTADTTGVGTFFIDMEIAR